MIYVDNRNSNIDNDCNIGFKETRSFLYRYFTNIIAANGTSRKLNFVFIKATFLYTKEEDNKLRI